MTVWVLSWQDWNDIRQWRLFQTEAAARQWAQKNLSDWLSWAVDEEEVY